jgi:hypothetical protein
MMRKVKRSAGSYAVAGLGLLCSVMILVGSGSSVLAAPAKLATANPFDVAVRGGYVYWSELVEEFCTSTDPFSQGSLKRVSVSGGTVETLYSSCDFSPANIAVDSDWVYAVDWHGDRIVRISIKGGTPQEIAKANGAIYHRGLEVDDTFVFWADDDGLKRATKDGLSTVTLVTTDVNDLTTDVSHVYWSGGEIGSASIKRVGKNGGASQTLASGLNYPRDLAVDESFVYWADSDSIRRMPKIGGAAAPTTSYSNSGTQVAHLAVRDSRLFWTETDSAGSIGSGKVRSASKTGGAQSSIATGLSGPGGINIDGQYAYWGDGDGIKRVGLSAAPGVQIEGGYGFFKPEGDEQSISGPVFLRGGDQPTFRTKLSATAVTVDVFAPSTSAGLTLVKSLSLQKSGNQWAGKWDWTSSSWSNSEQIPVGAFVARFKPAAGATYELPFYVVFNPQEVGVSASHAFTLDKQRGEYALWFASDSTTIGGKVYGRDWVIEYALHPDDNRIFGQTIGLIAGQTSTSAAAQKVLDWLEPQKGTAKCVCAQYSGGKCVKVKAEPVGDPSSGYRWRYTTCASSKDVLTLLMRTDQMAQCADSAGLCVAMLRSIGIPAHPVTADAAVEYGTATWGFDTWVEARFKGGSGTQWYAAHPHEGYAWTTRATAGTWGVASEQDNDIVFMADDTWPITVVPYSLAAQFGYGTPCKQPEQTFATLVSWVEHLCQSNPTGGGYWSKGHWECSPPQGSDIVIQTDQPNYQVGDTAHITVSIHNPSDAPLVGELNVDLAIDQLLTKQFPDSTLTISSNEISVPPGESVDIALDYELPGSLSSFDSHLIVARVDEEQTLLPFGIEPLYQAQFTVPAKVYSGDVFTAQLIVVNNGGQQIESILVELKVPFGVEVTEGAPTQTIGSVEPGEEASLIWNLVAGTPSELAVIEAEIVSWNGGGSLEIQDVDILGPPGLTVECAYTELEPNDSIEGADLGGSIPGSFCFDAEITDGNPDYFAFDVDSSYWVTIVTTLPEGGDTILLLLDEWGEEIAFNDDDPNGGLGSFLEKCLTAGRYYVVVNSYDATATFPYVLSIEGVDPCEVAAPCDYQEMEENDSIEGADFGGSIPGSFCFDAEIADGNPDFFAFDVDSSHWVTIVTTLPEGGDTILLLLDEWGEEIAFNDDAPGGGLESLVHRCLPPGRYYVSVSSYDVAATFAYVLSIEGVDPCEVAAPCDYQEMDENDSIEGADLGGSIPGSFCFDAEITDGNPDFFAFDVDSSHWVTIVTTLPKGGDTILLLLDEWGEEIAFNDDAPTGGRESFLSECLPPGRYYVGVGSYDEAATFPYVLSIRGVDPCR